MASEMVTHYLAQRLWGRVSQPFNHTVYSTGRKGEDGEDKKWQKGFPMLPSHSVTSYGNYSVHLPKSMHLKEAENCVLNSKCTCPGSSRCFVMIFTSVRVVAFPQPGKVPSMVVSFSFQSPPHVLNYRGSAQTRKKKKPVLGRDG